MKQYLDLLRKVLQDGDPQYNERTGHLMIVSAGDQSIYDLREGFPRCTTKPSVSMRWVGEEVFWMLRGERNAKTLYDKGVDIWNRNAYQQYLKNKGLEHQIKKNTPEWGESFKEYEMRMKEPDFPLEDADLGPVYGYQWRNFDGNFIMRNIDEALNEVNNIMNIPEELCLSIKKKFANRGTDQLLALIEGIKKDKGSRYHMLTAWNPNDLKDMALGPCHCISQFTITRDRDLDLHMWQRSCDVYLGVPFNIVQYSLLNHLIAGETGFEARKFIHSYGNVHIYGGVSPRSDFLKQEDNLRELQKRVRNANTSEDFLSIREWYLQNAPEEDKYNRRKDHIPFVLYQLSLTPGILPKIEIEKMPFFELIKQPADKVIKLVGGDKPLRWDSRAVMAA